MTEQEAIISQTKLFVGGLDWSIRGRELNDEFSKFGVVKFARVKLSEDGKSRWFGFVEFENAEDTAKAKAWMNGQELKGRVINVDFAKENPERLAERAAKQAAAEEAATQEDTPL